MKDHVKILRYLPHRNFNHSANQAKGWESLGVFEVGYYDIGISCALMRGRNDKGNNNYFYFLEMPCVRFKNKQGRWFKSNYMHFSSKEISDKFQNLAFGIILEEFPQLFDEIFLRDRAELAVKKEPQINTPKARNKSKFEKEKLK